MNTIESQSAFVNKDAITVPVKDYALRDLSLAVKDLFHIEGLPTAAGNPSWLATHSLPSYTNSSVETLLEHGIKYRGKTVTDELAYSLNGQNMHYPTLVNPVTPERLVGGSSSGSALAVAAKLADIGLGTDTGGSIRVPASYNGLYGLRTTFGAIENDNMVALAPNFDTIGWLANRLSHIERIAKCLMPKQSLSTHSQIRLCVFDNLVEQVEHAGLIHQWLSKLQNVSVQNHNFDLQAYATSESFRVLQGQQIWQQHGKWISEQKPQFSPDIEARFMWCKSITEQQVTQAKTQQAAIEKHVLALFDNCDAIVIPTTPGRAPLVTTPASELASYREDLMGLTAIAGLVGLPQLHLPLFKLGGAPCGLSLIGNRHSDTDLVALAQTLIYNE